MVVKVEDLKADGYARRAAVAAWGAFDDRRHTTEDRKIIRVIVSDVPSDKTYGMDVSILGCCNNAFITILRRNSLVVAQEVKIGTPWPKEVTCEATVEELIQHRNELIRVAGETAIADGIANGQCGQVEETLTSIGIPPPPRRNLLVTLRLTRGHETNGREFPLDRYAAGDTQVRYRLHQMLIRSGLPDLAPLISSVRYVNPDDE